MARIRTIKPEFFTSEDIAALPLRARLTFAGLWTYADDYGNAKAVPALIKGALWPLDDDIQAAEVAEDLRLLEAGGQISFYEVDGRRYLSIVKWASHQKVDRPSVKRLPEPPSMSPRAIASSTRETPSSPRAESAQDREGDRDLVNGGGGETPPAPSPYCERHPQGTEQPCTACGIARKAAKQWSNAYDSPTARAGRVVALGRQLDEFCPQHDGYPLAGGCAACKRERLAVSA